MAVRMEIVGAKGFENGTQVLMLREIGGTRFIAIQMRIPDLASVVAARSRLMGPRPSAHIAWAATIRSARITLDRLIIHGLGGDDAALCLLCFRQAERAWTVDCRPGDGIALALRLGAPIECEEPILQLLTLETDKLKQQERQADEESWRRYFESIDSRMPKQ